MQIHELTKKQLNEVDLAGPEGLANQTKTAYQVAKQPGALGSLVKSQQTAPQGSGMLQRAKTALASNPLTSTAALAQSDFVKRMQTVKNSAAMKQVAANIQQQWEQTRKTFPAAQAAPAAATTPAVNYNVPAYLRKQKTQAAQQAPTPTTTTSAPGYSSVKTNQQASIPSVGKSNLPTPTQATQQTKTVPTTPASASTTAGTYNKKTGAATLGGKSMVAAKDLPPNIQKQIAAVTETSTHPITEAASLPQITDWFTKAVIPQSMAKHQEEYLKNPTIQGILKGIVAAENQPDDKKRQELQAAEFLNLVSAAGAVSQQIAATQPQTAATGAGATAPQSSSVQSATSDLEKLAGLSPTQIAAIQKIFAGASPVSTQDPNTANFLQALGLTVS